ncbi:MAG: translation elongation factor P [Terriglobia bacterium]|jgi:elongation factor P
MFLAADLKEGMVIRIEGQIYRVLEAESKAGAAKLGGVIKTKLSNVRTGHIWEPHFRPQERLEEVQLERRILEFVFGAGDACTFMSPQTFEQWEVPRGVLGPAEKFLQPGMHLPVEFFAGEPLRVAFPEVAEVRVAETAPPAHAQQETAWKEAKLENGLSVQVPMFIGRGEVVRVEVRTGHYSERVRVERKRGA